MRREGGREGGREGKGWEGFVEDEKHQQWTD
jgi:hypothetical protein